MSQIEEISALFEIINPYVNKFNLITEKQKTVSDEEKIKLDSAIAFIQRALPGIFANTALNIETWVRDNLISYKLMWKGRRKYFIQNKKEFLGLITIIVKILYNKEVEIKDVRISGNRRIIILVQE